MIINLNPHPVTVHGENGAVKTYQAGPVAARVRCDYVKVGEVDGFPVKVAKFSELTNLPDFVQGTTLIVSRIVFDAAGHRDDLVCPGAGIRDKEGRVIACEGFSR
jgi:hypothetical protein